MSLALHTYSLCGECRRKEGRDGWMDGIVLDGHFPPGQRAIDRLIGAKVLAP